MAKEVKGFTEEEIVLPKGRIKVVKNENNNVGINFKSIGKFSEKTFDTIPKDQLQILRGWITVSLGQEGDPVVEKLDEDMKGDQEAQPAKQEVPAPLPPLPQQPTQFQPATPAQQQPIQQQQPMQQQPIQIDEGLLRIVEALQRWKNG